MSRAGGFLSILPPRKSSLNSYNNFLWYHDHPYFAMRKLKHRQVYNKPKILKPVMAGPGFEARLFGFRICALNLHAPLPWNKADSLRQCHHLHWKVMSLWVNHFHHFLMMWNQIGLIFILADIWWKLCLRPAVLKLLLILVPSSSFNSFWEYALNLYWHSICLNYNFPTKANGR